MTFQQWMMEDAAGQGALPPEPPPSPPPPVVGEAKCREVAQLLQVLIQKEVGSWHWLWWESHGAQGHLPLFPP